MKIQTKSGFVCNIDEDKVKDWRFARALAKCDAETTAIQGMSMAVTFLLGDSGESALMDHVKEESGAIPTEKVISEFKEILELAGAEIKKSQSSQE